MGLILSEGIWERADVSEKYDEDLFECRNCDVEFSLASDKIEGKKIVCPVCQMPIKPWQKRWNP